MNNVNLVGRLTRTPELREVNRATSVATIFVATDRPKLNKDGHTYKGDDGFTVKETEYHKVTCFNGLGKTVQQHCDKGMKVLVRGRIHYTKWTDAAGVDRYGCEIIAETVDFLSRAKQTENDDGKFIDDDDIPF